MTYKEYLQAREEAYEDFISRLKRIKCFNFSGFMAAHGDLIKVDDLVAHMNILSRELSLLNKLYESDKKNKKDG